MGRLARFTQLIFGSSAGTNQMAQYGSLAAGSPTLYSGSTISPSIVQSLANYLTGWYGATIGANSPAKQDMNALFYLMTYQLAYLMQAGISEYDPATTYYTGSLAQDGSGNVYVSRVDSNTGHALTNTNYWKLFTPGALNPQANTAVATRAVTQWAGKNASAANSWLSVVWSPELGIFVAGAHGLQAVMTSPDGITWTTRTIGGGGAGPGCNGLAWSPELNLFVAVDTGGSIMSSPDGITWTVRTSPSIESWWSVCWSPDLGKFVACAKTGGAGTNHFMYSSDGITWTGVTAGAGSDWSSVCWSGALGLFVAVAGTGTNQVATSPDGITWTLRAAAAAKQWSSVVWSHQLGMFAAVSFDGAAMTSYDGINWTSRTPVGTSNSWYSIAWSPQLGAFASVAQSGQIMYSFDGINWSAATAPAATVWSGITWSPQKGIFVAVSQTGTNQVMISKYVQKFAS